MVLKPDVAQLVRQDEEALRDRQAGQPRADDDVSALVHETVVRAIEHLETHIGRHIGDGEESGDVSLDQLAFGVAFRYGRAA